MIQVLVSPGIASILLMLTSFEICFDSNRLTCSKCSLKLQLTGIRQIIRGKRTKGEI